MYFATAMDIHGLFFIIILCSKFSCLFGDPTFNLKSKSQDATDGESSFLECIIRGSGAENYTISWLYGGVPVVNTTRRYWSGNKLYFQAIDKDLDSNKFQCQATEKFTEAEFVSDPIQLSIKWLQVGDVELKNPSKPFQIVQNMKGRVVLKCNIAGSPKPNNFSWYKSNSLVQRGGNFQIKEGRLVIKRPKTGINDGSYTCCATYPFGDPSSRHRCTPTGGAFNLRILNGSTPRLVKAPQKEVVVVKGSNVQLDCIYQAVPPPEILWRRSESSKEIPKKSRSGKCRKKCSFPNGTLLLVNFKENWEGEYECYAKQDGVKTPSVSVSIRLAYINGFKVTSTERFVHVGEKFENRCEVPPSLPSADIIWTRARDNRVIGQGNGHLATISMNTLIIDNVEESDAGVYTCTAENKAGRVSRNVTVALKVPPTFSKLPDKRACEGDNVTWTCQIHGDPFSTVVWHKGDVDLHDLQGKRIIKGTRLTLINVDMTDQALYYCSATNNISEPGSKPVRSNKAHLYIDERLKFWPVPRDTCLVEGDERRIECKVNGSDTTQIKWSKLNSTQAIYQLSSSHSQSLVFMKPNESSAGLYQCTASAPPRSINAVIRISVVKRPKILVPPRKMNVSEGKGVMFHCATAQDETSQVTWKFGDKSYGPSQPDSIETHLTVFPNGSLFIHRAQTSDSGDYTCSYTHCDFITEANALLSVFRDTPEDPYGNLPDDNRSTNSQMVQTIALSVSGGIVYVLLTIAVLIYCRRKRRRKRENNDEQTEEERMLNGSCNGRQHGNHDDEIVNMNNAIPMETLYRLDPQINNLLYPHHNIDPVVVIGKGEFGDVFLSKAPGLFPDLEEDILVMVKAFQPYQDGEDTSSVRSSAIGSRSEFNREINLLHRASHENVVKLLAVSSKHSELKPDHLITEYLEWGILKLCLEASRDGRISKLGKNHKMGMCCQLACGMEHLSKLGLVHKDIATRNCVISSQLLVKISMLGLTREGFENDYYNLDGKRLPVRWMAPEALLEGRYSSKSDVWSFAVACWEVFTLGETPYDELSNEEYIDAMHSDDWPRLPPLEGSKRITSLIRKCCHHAPHQRPEIKQIMRKLQSITGSGDAPDDDQAEAKALVPEQAADDTTDDSDER